MSLERFIGILTGAAPDVTAEEIADALWLAGQYPVGSESMSPAATEDRAASIPGGIPAVARESGAVPPHIAAATGLAGNSAARSPALAPNGDGWSGVYAR